MTNEQTNGSTRNTDDEPRIKNEAFKNTELVAEDKKNKGLSTGEDFPGYPHYAPEEDVLNPSSGIEVSTVDVEQITQGGRVAQADSKSPVTTPVEDLDTSEPEGQDNEAEMEKMEADVTEEDIMLLGPKDQDMDLGEDEEFQNPDVVLSATGEDLDVPGGELDDRNEEIGEEDEENNYYSLGGDNHSDLEDPE